MDFKVEHPTISLSIQGRDAMAASRQLGIDADQEEYTPDECKEILRRIRQCTADTGTLLKLDAILRYSIKQDISMKLKAI